MKLLRRAVELGWCVVVGAGLGFVAAAIADGFVSPWQGVWTALLVGAGALVVPAAAITVAWRPGRGSGGLILGWLVLAPFAGYARWRARQQRKTAAPESVGTIQELNAG